MITIRFNGKDLELPAKITLNNFLVEKDLNKDKLIIELNGKLLNDFESDFCLSDGDVLNLFSLVAGG